MKATKYVLFILYALFLPILALIILLVTRKPLSEGPMQKMYDYFWINRK